MTDDIGARIDVVRSRIGEACARAGRDPGEVTLVAVSKTRTPEDVGLAHAAGVSHFGENYAQELTGKRDAAPDATWHFIGRVQRNKARRILELADLIETIEPGPAMERLRRLAEESKRRVRCLVEVDTTGHRVGAPPDPGAIGSLLDALDGTALRVEGLMAVAPPREDPRPWFARLRTLRDELRGSFPGLTELSMGMSADYESAVEEGATMVRVGTAIFGPRP